MLQSDPSTAFLRAARAGQLEKVLEYLESGVDINASNAVSRKVFVAYNSVIINCPIRLYILLNEYY